MSARGKEIAVHSSREVVRSGAERRELEAKVAHKAGEVAVGNTVENPLRTFAIHDLGEEATRSSIESGDDIIDVEWFEIPEHENSSQEGWGAISGVKHQPELMSAPEQAVLPPAPEQPVLPSAPEKLALPPVPEVHKKLPIVMGEVGRDDDAERKAHELKNRHIEAKKENNAKRSLFNPRRVFRSVWGYEKNDRKYLEQARTRVKESGSVHGADESWTDDQRNENNKLVINRFVDGSHDAIDTAAGENREYFDDEHDAAVGAKELLKEFAENRDMTDEVFMERMQEVRALMGEGETSQNEMYVDNYLEAARAIRGRAEQGEAMDDVLEGFKLMRGEARSDVRSEIHKTKLDQLYDKFEQSKFGQIMPASALAVGVGIGLFVAERGAKSTALKVGTIGASALLIGSIAAAKRHGENNRLRSIQQQEKARGKEYTSGNKKETKLSEFEYKQVTSESMIEGLEDVAGKFGEDELDGELAVAAINKLADIQAVKDVSAEKGVELIDAGGDQNKREQDRMAIARGQAELKGLVANAVKTGNTHMLEALGLDPATNIDTLLNPDDINGLLPDELQQARDEKLHSIINHAVSLRSESFAKGYNEDISKVDKAWSKYNAIDSAKAGAITGGASLVVGSAMQEVLASFSADKAGLVERAWGADNNSGAHNTVLGNFVGDSGSGTNTEHVSGTLSQDRINEIKANGGSIKDLSPAMTKETVPGRESVSDYIKNHKGEMRTFSSVDLYENGTSQSDLNELGGAIGKGENGSVRVWANMTAEGSRNANGKIDMTNGPSQFTMAFKEPDGSHSFKVFEYGQDVPKPWADMLYEKSDGSWGFKGDGYVAWGRTAGDHLDVAASIAGDGENVALDTTTVKIVETPQYEVSYQQQRDMDGFAPVAWRGSQGIGVAQHKPKSAPAVTPPVTPKPGSEVDRIPPAPVESRPEEDVFQRDANDGERIAIEHRPQEQKEIESKPNNQEVDLVRKTGESEKVDQIELESKQRQIAREAGWQLDSINIAVDQDVPKEVWQDAVAVLEAVAAEYPEVTDPVEKLHRAVGLFEQGKFTNPETQGLFRGLFSMNETRRERARSEESSTAPPQSSEEVPPRQSAPTEGQEQPGAAPSSNQSAPADSANGGNKKREANALPDDVRQRVDLLDARISGILSVSADEARTRGLTQESFDQIRDAYTEIVLAHGSDITDKKLYRALARKFHGDVNDSDSAKLFDTINYIFDKLD